MQHHANADSTVYVIRHAIMEITAHSAIVRVGIVRIDIGRSVDQRQIASYLVGKNNVVKVVVAMQILIVK